MSLSSRLIAAAKTTPALRREMFELMDRSYANMRREDFERDLATKEWIILIEDGQQGKLRGFSTQTLLRHHFRGEEILILFSGDTIIDPACWGSMELPLAWGRLMIDLVARHPGSRLFWLLTSKGYRTYRFLPVFFREFWPRYDRPTPPWERGLMRNLGVERYSRAFDPRSGTIRAAAGAQRLRRRLDTFRDSIERDPHVSFFLERNPSYARGDELLCLAPLGESNLKPFIRRRLETRSHVGEVP